MISCAESPLVQKSVVSSILTWFLVTSSGQASVKFRQYAQRLTCVSEVPTLVARMPRRLFSPPYPDLLISRQYQATAQFSRPMIG